MAIVEISKEFRFEAAHSLPHLPRNHKCSRPHGHSYKIEVVCRGEVDADWGWLIDYAEITKIVKPFIEALDHRDLNQVLPGKTTAEELAIWLFRGIDKRLVCLYEVRVYETATTCVTYRGALDDAPSGQ